MGFYDDAETANQYISMAEGYDGRGLINVLRTHLPEGATVLEMGMGPGVDLKILKKHFRVTGSDNSKFFLDRFRESDPNTELLFLDAIELDTQRTFDCIYSNKVLHHLTNDELTKSLRRQKTILTSSGMIMHSFWCGTGVEEHQVLRFVYQTEDSIRSIFGRLFNILEVVVYEEMERNDSLYVLATK